MKYKPDEGVLISYLYGELDEAEKVKVQGYLQENPEEMKHLQHMKAVLGILEKVEDKEVIAPPIFMDDATKTRSFWSSKSFRTVLSIAASFLLILVAARLLQVEVSYSGNELRIVFGGSTVKQAQPVDSGISEEQVQKLIDASMAKSNEMAETRLAETQQKLDQSIRQNLAANSQRINDLVRQTSAASQDQLTAFVAGLRSENLQLMKDYLQLSSNDQKKYVEGLLVDFSKYLQEQRNSDLQMFQTRFSTIEQNSNLFKQETEQILASIISNSNATNTKNSY